MIESEICLSLASCYKSKKLVLRVLAYLVLWSFDFGWAVASCILLGVLVAFQSLLLSTLILGKLWAMFSSILQSMAWPQTVSFTARRIWCWTRWLIWRTYINQTTIMFTIYRLLSNGTVNNFRIPKRPDLIPCPQHEVIVLLDAGTSVV